MSVQPQYLEFILEQLGGLGGVTSRRMFGGVGLYRGELFFGLIDDDTLFFKTNATNSAEYESRHMPRFMPPVNRPMGPMGYHQVPADIIEDAEALVSWARKSVAVALASRAAKAKPPAAARRKPRAAAKKARARKAKPRKTSRRR
jgi:DNA transformation protein and related proteins